jgi:translation elongation factor EF-1beta
LEVVKPVELSTGKAYVRSLRFRDFARFVNLITRLFKDFRKGDITEVNLLPYFEEAIPLIASMSGLKEEEVENLPVADGLRLLKTCVEVILEDQAFLEEVKNLLKTVAEGLTKVSPSTK